MKKTFIFLLPFLTGVLWAQSAKVSIDKFVVRKGEHVSLFISADSAVDTSKNTQFCQADKERCHRAEAGIAINAKVMTEGLTTIGPYQIKEDFVNLPNNHKTINIEIPPSNKKQDCDGNGRSM